MCNECSRSTCAPLLSYGVFYSCRLHAMIDCVAEFSCLLADFLFPCSRWAIFTVLSLKFVGSFLFFSHDTVSSIDHFFFIRLYYVFYSFRMVLLCSFRFFGETISLPKLSISLHLFRCVHCCSLKRFCDDCFKTFVT